MSIQLITINLVVLNGEKYIRHCLDGILAQTYPSELIELNILDNGSVDNTVNIIKERASFDRLRMPKFFLLESKKNLGMWPGQEELLKYSNGKYILAMAVDVILDKDFVKNSVEAMEKDEKIGALEAKIYKYDLINEQVQKTSILDTCGFQIFKSRRIINIGHGLSSAEASASKGFNTDEQQEIFGVEGAAPFFRREALEDCSIVYPSTSSGSPDSKKSSEIFDHDYFWYGDDLDFVWRMNMFGWKQVFAPSVTAWHDRQTTKELRQNFRDFLAIRKAIPLRKRRLEWKNVRFTIIKNDYIINILKDLPHVLKREVMMLGYLIFFEPKIFLEIPSFLRLLPRMMAKRKEIMRKAVVKPEEMRRWFK